MVLFLWACFVLDQCPLSNIALKRFAFKGITVCLKRLSDVFEALSATEEGWRLAVFRMCEGGTGELLSLLTQKESMWPSLIIQDERKGLLSSKNLTLKLSSVT